MRAFVQAGVAPRWLEHLQGDAPSHARGYGSPTILVDGRDVAGGSPGEHACCRLYESESAALAGVPDLAAIARAITSTASKTAAERWCAALRRVEVIAAECAACESTMELVERTASAPCELIVWNASDPQIAARAEWLGVRSFPALVIDGKLADCCTAQRGDAIPLRGADAVGQEAGR